MRAFIAAAVVLSSVGASVRADFITNASFEDVPDTSTGQGFLPTGWLQTGTFTPGADTYSNDGSYGLAPDGFGNFPGVTAFDGIRWVAGAAFGRLASSTTVAGEAFGRVLETPLTPLEEYRVDAHLHQALRTDLANPGGYHLFLAVDGSAGGLAGALLLGALAPTTAAGGWEARSLTFIAPSDAASRTLLIFAPYQVTSGNAYPGIDVTTVRATAAAVPQPAGLTMALTGLVGMGLALSYRRRKKACQPATLGSSVV